MTCRATTCYQQHNRSLIRVITLGPESSVYLQAIANHAAVELVSPRPCNGRVSWTKHAKIVPCSPTVVLQPEPRRARREEIPSFS